MINNEYKVAVAMLQFKTAYHNLVEATKSMPDLDVSNCYPFYLLDFEEIEPAVMQWCSIHAAELMKHLPERVDNPGCLACQYFRAGLTPGGICKGSENTSCGIYPTLVYMKEYIIPYMTSVGIDVTSMKEEEIHLLYLKKCEDKATEKQTK